MTDLGLMCYFLGIDISHELKRFFICQKKYIENLLKKLKRYRCKAIATPLTTNEKNTKEYGLKKDDGLLYRSLIGSLLYQTTTRLNIMYILVFFRDSWKNYPKFTMEDQGRY